MAMPTHTDEAIRSDTWLPPKRASQPKIGITIANSATRTNNGISEITGVGILLFSSILFFFLFELAKVIIMHIYYLYFLLFLNK